MAVIKNKKVGAYICSPRYSGKLRQGDHLWPELKGPVRKNK
jgi:hypothetical protein